MIVANFHSNNNNSTKMIELVNCCQHVHITLKLRPSKNSNSCPTLLFFFDSGGLPRVYVHAQKQNVVELDDESIFC